MKRLAALFLLALLPSFAHAEEDKLLLFSDAALTDSTLNDSAPDFLSVYVVHTNFWNGVTYVRFSIEPTAGFTGVWIGETSQYLVLGTSTTDLSVTYAACLVDPVLVLTVTYQLFGSSSPCSGLKIAPAAGQPCVLTDLCFGERCVTGRGTLQVNCPVATEATTWGRVKALYR